MLAPVSTRFFGLGHDAYAEPWERAPGHRVGAESVHAVRHGSAHLTMDGAEYQVQAGDAMLWSHGMTLSRRLVTDPPFRVTWITFDARIYGQALLSTLYPRPLCLSGASAACIHELVERAEDETKAKRTFWQLSVEGLILQILSVAYQAPKVDIMTPVRVADSRAAKSIGTHEAVREVLAAITTRWSEPLALDWLARKVGLSSSYLCDLFRRQVGVSPMRFLEQVRMHEAERLMLKSDVPITTVAQAVGYEDPYYFSRAFRRTHGLSPSAFRARLKKVHPLS